MCVNAEKSFNCVDQTTSSMTSSLLMPRLSRVTHMSSSSPLESSASIIFSWRKPFFVISPFSSSSLSEIYTRILPQENLLHVILIIHVHVYVVIEFNFKVLSVNVHNYNKLTHVHALPRIHVLNHINNKKAKSPFPVHVLLYNVIIKHNNNENNHFFQKEAIKKEISHVPSTTSHSSSPTSSSLVRMLYQLNSSRLIVPFPSRSDRSKTSSSTFL